MDTALATEAAVSTDQTFIVSSSPPWYFDTVDHSEVFTCSQPGGVFEAVVTMMTQKEQSLSREEHLRYRPRVLNKMIRDTVIMHSGRICQRPSRSLLLALMDLVDLLGGNEFGSIATSDRAGLKQVLLTSGNYTAYHLPAEALRGKDRMVVPVVTQYSAKENLLRYDPTRSMVGTYMTAIHGNDGENKGSYFMQEVLFAPTQSSLKLLSKVVGSAFDFWDMSLEMPTHLEALRPSFQQIQPCQLMISNPTGSTGKDQSSQAALASHLEDVEPMCCAPEMSQMQESSSDRTNKKGGACVDCFGEDAVKCDLSRFTYERSIGRMVYFRSGGRKRRNILPTVAVREEQRHLPVLYVSTTLRFYRALKRSCVKGNGEPVNCWNETLQEMARGTFLSGELTFQEIQHCALSAFTKRVDLKGWCNRIPRHVESKLMVPRMIEVAELAITFMNAKIPSAFAVAELLHSPTRTLQRYSEFLSRYASDATFKKSERARFAASVMELIRKECGLLARQLRCYSKDRKDVDPETARRAKACAEMVDREPWEVNKIQKDWYTMCKHDQCNKDKEEQAHAKEVNAAAKVAFFKLKVYCSKLKELGSNAARLDGELSDRNPCHREAVNHREGRREPSKDGSALFTPIPEAVPVSTWIRNLSVLLLSHPWLHDSTGCRREAVCKLLNLDGALLSETNRELLREWVAYNQGTVNELRKRGIKDRLSRALTRCLESQSTQGWSDKVATSFAAVHEVEASRQPPRRLFSPQPVKKPAANDVNTGLAGHDRGRKAERRGCQTASRARRWLPPSAERVRVTRSPVPKRRRVRQHPRDSYFLSEAEEDNCLEPPSPETEEELEQWGEDNGSSSESSDDEGSDNYNYNSFIDDASSSGDEAPNRRGYKRVLSSDDSEIEDALERPYSGRLKGRGSRFGPSVERSKRLRITSVFTRRQGKESGHDTEDASDTYYIGRKHANPPEGRSLKSASGAALRLSSKKAGEVKGRGSVSSSAWGASSRSSSSESRGSESEGSGQESEGQVSGMSTASIRSHREHKARNSLKSADQGKRCLTVRHPSEKLEIDDQTLRSPAKPKQITPSKLSGSLGSSAFGCDDTYAGYDPPRKRSVEWAGPHAERPEPAKDPKPIEIREPDANLLDLGEGSCRIWSKGKDKQEASRLCPSRDSDVCGHSGESEEEGCAAYSVTM